MVETNLVKKQQSSANNKSFNEQNQTKIVLRHLPPTLTSEQLLENISPLPDHDYYRFCKADLSLGQQYSFCRAYFNIPNQQDLIIFTEKFQGYIFLDKNGNEYICSVEYSPNQTKSKCDQQTRQDPKMNSIEQDPEYQTFLVNLNSSVNTGDALPNAETMLEEIEKKQREIHEMKNKSGMTTTPLLEYLKRKRDERKQEKIIRIQHAQQRRNTKQQSRNNPSNINDDSRLSSGRNINDEHYNSSSRYAGGERSNRHQQRGFDKGDYRTNNNEQKRSNVHDHSASKSSKHHNPKGKQQQQQQQRTSQMSKEFKIVNNTKINTEELSSSLQIEHQIKRDSISTETTNETIEHNELTSSTNKSSLIDNQKNPIKTRPSIQIYNPGERARLRRQQNSSS